MPWSWDDEEEEEDDSIGRGAPVQSGALDADEEEVEEEDDEGEEGFDVGAASEEPSLPGATMLREPFCGGFDDDGLGGFDFRGRGGIGGDFNAFGGAAVGASDLLDLGGLRSGLRQRTAAGAEIGDGARARAAGRGDGGLLLDDDDDAGPFLLGSERLDAVDKGRGAAAAAALQPLRQLGLLVLVLAGLWAAACERRPSEESFRDLRTARYGLGPNVTGSPPAQFLLDWGLPLQTDRSFEGKVARTRFVEHGPFAFGTIFLKVAPAESSKVKQAPPPKVYEHRYLGFLGTWLPLPYLPQPGTKARTFGVGACLLGRCACVPRRSLEKAGASAGGVGGGASSRRGRSECLRFEGGKSMTLNVMALPNIIFFGLWQFPSNWGPLSAHTMLSLANLSRGRFWVLLAAPFCHRAWGEIFHIAIMLTNAIDSFDRAEVHFVVFIALYLAGSWAAWLVRTVVVRRILQNDTSAFYAQEWGASAGLAAQLLFLARIRPQEKFQFSFYFVPIPVTLSAWQSCFAHGLLDILMAKGEGFWRQLLSHVSAWAVGWVVASAWLEYV